MAKTLSPSAGGPGLMSDQRTRHHMLQINIKLPSPLFKKQNKNWPDVAFSLFSRVELHFCSSSVEESVDKIPV